MKRLIFFAFILFSIDCTAQFLSFDELISLQKKDFSNIDDFLSEKGWQFSHSNEKENTITWAYNKNAGLARAWLKLGQLNGYNTIEYQTANTDFYSKIKGKILEYKMKPSAPNIQDEGILTYYVGANYVVGLSLSSKEFEDNTNYIFTIIPKVALQEFAEEKTNDKILEKKQSTYNGDYEYQVTAYSGSSIYKSIECQQIIYSVPTNNVVYVIKDNLAGNKCYVFCNGYYGYMYKSSLND